MYRLFASIFAFGLSSPLFADDFAEHPASDQMQWSEPVTFPQFDGRDADYRNFRTRIREALKEGPNFAGHYTIVVIGCGTSCRFGYVADARTGQVFPFPYGGEENYEMNLDFRADSRLVIVTWADLTSNQCIEHEIVWDRGNFKIVGESSSPRVDFCNN